MRFGRSHFGNLFGPQVTRQIQSYNHLVAYNEWFERKVKDSQAAGSRGEAVPDEDVRTWLECRERR
jgi:hypothetical protein